MAVSIDITGLPDERVVFAPSPLAELGAALHVLAEPGHHPGLHGWATATASGLDPALADRLHQAEFLWRSTRADILLPPQPGATLEEELDRLDELDDERFVASALEISCGGSYSQGSPSPLVDGTQRRLAIERATARGPRQAQFAVRLMDEPGTVRKWIRRLLEDCEQAFFRDLWQRTRVQLAADARHKTELLQHKGLAEALSSASAALSVEEPLPDDPRRRVVVDKLTQGRTTAVDPALPGGPGLTFLPTALGWPHLLALYAPGWRPVVTYPVVGAELPQPVELDLMRRRMEALSHPQRMRLCLSLARAPYTTGELANTFGLTAPEVSRHLKVMKEAGLVTTRRRGRYVQHRLDLTSVARLGSDFLETVLR
ncbi:DUF5937 family protein [Streptomyces sp. HNM0574]|uniref:DUF5937 family protein n=1 Tax=Streptomyces sp. HNM0574 TaxID=2714954 RepID=UPI00146CFFA3|nr:DUF5937 family protein [Streptomyces sp. HNM0574]NLU67954.1 winged helix-turn-helix transcriptional regulator [Streptomyces sp. HNM0574]